MNNAQSWSHPHARHDQFHPPLAMGCISYLSFGMTHNMTHDVLIKLRVARAAIWRNAAPGRHDLAESTLHAGDPAQKALPACLPHLPKVTMPPGAR